MDDDDARAAHWDDALRMARPARPSPAGARERVSALKSPPLVRKALARRATLLLRELRARKAAAEEAEDAPMLAAADPPPRCAEHDWEAVGDADAPRSASLLRCYYERARAWIAQALALRPPPSLDVGAAGE